MMEFLHGTRLIINILHTWVNKQRRVVSVDKYFPSVQVCDELNNRGLELIVVMKKVTRDLCMAKLSEIELARRGLWKGYFAQHNEKKLDKFAFV